VPVIDLDSSSSSAAAAAVVPVIDLDSSSSSAASIQVVDVDDVVIQSSDDGDTTADHSAANVENPLDVGEEGEQQQQQQDFGSDVSDVLEFTPPHTSTPTHSSDEDETGEDEQDGGSYWSITVTLWHDGDGEGTEENPVVLSSDTSVGSSDEYVNYSLICHESQPPIF
jgi:hypothetical protein